MTLSYRFYLVFDLLFTVVNLLIYFFISRVFAGTRESFVGNAPDYFSYAAVGVALSLVLQATSTGLASRFREQQVAGTLEILVAQPVTPAEITIGLTGFPFLFATLRVTIYLLGAGLLLDMDLSNADWVGFVVMLVASGFALAGIGVTLVALVLVVKRAEIFVGMVSTALAMLGGAFFTIAVLPSWLQPVAEALPTRFAFEGTRAALFEGGNWEEPALVLVGFSLVALPLSVLAFTLALVFTKRHGTLATY